MVVVTGLSFDRLATDINIPLTAVVAALVGT
jgi:hypothetical protein